MLQRRLTAARKEFVRFGGHWAVHDWATCAALFLLIFSSSVTVPYGQVFFLRLGRRVEHVVSQEENL